MQPAASADLSGVVFILSNPNPSPHVTGMRTLQFLQIINCSFLTQNTFKKYVTNIFKNYIFFARFNQQKIQKL